MQRRSGILVRQDLFQSSDLIATVSAEYCSSVEEASIGAFLKTCMTDLSVLCTGQRADFLCRMCRLPSCLYSVPRIGCTVHSRPESNWVSLRAGTPAAGAGVRDKGSDDKCRKRLSLQLANQEKKTTCFAHVLGPWVPLADGMLCLRWCLLFFSLVIAVLGQE